MRPIGRWLFFSVILLVVATAAAAFWFARFNPAVLVAQTARGPAVEAVYATAVVEPVFWARVGPRDTGRIADLLRREGDAVKRGEVLARLDDREALARIDEMETRANFLDGEVKRLAPLVELQYASRQAYDRAISDLGQARASLAGARQRLDDLILRAPLDGVVLRRDSEIGEVVSSVATLFWVGRPRPLRAVAEVDEEDIPRVRPGQTVLIKSDAFADRVLEGQVHEITPKGDPVNKSYRVYVALPDDTPLLIGMTLETNIVVRQTPHALLVPSGAVVQGAVWLVADGRARRQPVKIGVQGAGRIEIESGLTDGATVIVAPPDSLNDGMRVRPRRVEVPL